MTVGRVAMDQIFWEPLYGIIGSDIPQFNPNFTRMSALLKSNEILLHTPMCYPLTWKPRCKRLLKKSRCGSYSLGNYLVCR